LTDSGIVVRTGGKNRTFDKAELLSVKIVKEADSLKSLFTGGLLTAFYSPVLSMLARNSSDRTPFFSDSLTLGGSLLTTALQAGYGMAASALSASARRRVKSFGESGVSGLSLREWESLRSFTAGGATIRPPKLHLTADMGWTLGKAVEGTFAGHSSEEMIWERSRLNRLRRLRLEYAVSPSLSLGGAYAWLGEPSANGYDYEDWRSPYAWARINQDSRGCFLMLTFHPLKRGRSGSDWDVGAGIGAGVARLNLQVTNDYSYDSSSGLDIVSKTVPAFMAYASAGYSLSRLLSFGISADWTWAPCQETGVVPWAAGKSRRIAFSSGCIGFYLGLHI
jgi:hypothetical protein